MSQPGTKSVAIVGAGITGLVAARQLQRAGDRVSLFEKAPQVGGVIQSISEGGWLSESGPNSLQQSPEVESLINELGLAGQRVVANPAAKKRFIVRDGKLMSVPLSPAGLLTSPLFSLRARVRVLAELFKRPRIRNADTSLASFVTDHFGSEIADYGLDPLVSGIYAGDTDKLSSRHAFPILWKLERQHGSLLRGLRAQAAERRARDEPTGTAPIISFARGLQTLPDALASDLSAGTVHIDTTVTGLIPGRPWKLIWQKGESVETGEFDAVILAVPAPALGQFVFGALGERTLASLDNLPAPPVSSLFLGFRRDQVDHPLDGFGALVPSREKRSLLGVLFSSTLFPGRAPADHVALTVFAGGMRHTDTGRLATPQLLAKILPDLRELLGINGDPVLVRHTFWPRAIPQYNLGHERFLDPLTQCENRHPGLFIGGNSRDGISVPDCIRSGLKLATRVANG